jgi:hypothetical protein
VNQRNTAAKLALHLLRANSSDGRSGHVGLRESCLTTVSITTVAQSWR